MIVYIAGPYTDNPEVHVERAIEIAEVLANNGHVPIIPHLFHFWHERYPHPHDFWMDLDLQLVPLVDAVIRFSGPSPGAEDELQLAKSLYIPVFNGLTEFLNAT